MQQKQYQRPIRSFVLRQGRMTDAQKRAFDTLWQKYGIEESGQELDLDAIFKRKASHILEIGFGMGGSLLEMAVKAPDADFLGIEVHRPGVGTLLNGIEKEGIQNIRIICSDAVEILNQQIPDESFDRVQIFFPDPWPKKRHHKRRIIQPDFLTLLHAKLRRDGILHIATDWQPYAEWIMEMMTANDGFVNCAGVDQYANRPEYRPVTKFEKRGERLGHGVWDLIFKKR